MIRLASYRRETLLSLGALAGFALLATALLWNLPLNNDVSWQYWVARQLRGGARFGIEVKEINPPLWFWEAMPISALADRLGLSSTHLAVAAGMMRTALSLALVAALLPGETRRRLIAVAGLGAALLVLPIFDFGEREHLMLLGALPYAALIARRADRDATPRLLALATGLLAAPGFALKPHFVLVPLALELWLLWRLRRGWRPMRTETVTLALAAVLYVLATIVLAGPYLAGVLPIARIAYGDFGPPFLALFTHQIYLPAWLLGGLALALAPPRAARARAAGVATAAFLGCYLLQGKGFAYHALPVTVGIVWTLWLRLTERAPDGMPRVARALAVCAILIAFTLSALIGPFRAPSLGPLDRAIARLPRGTVFAVLSSHSWHAFPMVEQHGFVWPLSGGIALIELPMILREGEGPHATARGLSVRRWTLDSLYEDFARCPPQAILVDDAADSTVSANRGADYLAFLRTDPRFVASLDRYRPLASSGRTRLLIARPGMLAPASRCATPPSVPTPG